MIGLSETLLNENVIDTEINLPGFTCIRGDRTSASGKRNGGGVCFFINERWCNNATASANVCFPDIEFLTLSVRPFYHREFPKIYLCMVYYHPKANVDNACSVLTDHFHEVEKNSPDTPIIITAKRIQINKWDADSVDMLKGCMDCTDWDVFIKLSANVNKATNVISLYITFCEKLCIPVK